MKVISLHLEFIMLLKLIHSDVLLVKPINNAEDLHSYLIWPETGSQGPNTEYWSWKTNTATFYLAWTDRCT